MTEIFGVLANDGDLARELTQFITDHEIQLVFEDLKYADDCSGGIGGTIGPENGWWIPQPGVNQIVLNSALGGRCDWTATDLATVMAHEAEHIREVYANLFLDPTDLGVLWLEDVEGPAYITETLVWDSLRRNADGQIVLTTEKNDVDFRADLFIQEDGSIDVAGHNSFISQSRGIPPNCPYFDQRSCDSG